MKDVSFKEAGKNIVIYDPKLPRFKQVYQDEQNKATYLEERIVNFPGSVKHSLWKREI